MGNSGMKLLAKNVKPEKPPKPNLIILCEKYG
jgi:hypothetical protein